MKLNLIAVLLSASAWAEPSSSALTSSPPRTALVIRGAVPLFNASTFPTGGLGGVGLIVSPSSTAGLGAEFAVGDHWSLALGVDVAANLTQSATFWTMVVDPGVNWYVWSRLEGLYVGLHAPLARSEFFGSTSWSAGLGANVGFAARWSNGFFVSLSAGPTVALRSDRGTGLDSSGNPTTFASEGLSFALRSAAAVGAVF